MAASMIVPGLHILPLGNVNVYLLESAEGLILIDTGNPHDEGKILNAVRELGKGDIKHIILTHAHPDHFGSLNALKKATNAPTYVHPLDAEIARTGVGLREIYPAPGLLNYILFKALIRLPKDLVGGQIDHEINEGDALPGGLEAIFTPGHSAGHLSFMWKNVLFAADACANLMGLNYLIVYEDFEEGKRSMKKLAQRDFEIATFGHGKPIMKNASALFRKKWG